MKKLFFSLVAVAMFGFGQVMAQERSENVKSTKTGTMEVSNEEEKEITFAQLPNAVQKSMRADEYKGWDVGKVWHCKKDGKEYYKIEVEKDGEESKLKFDKDGKVMKNKEDKKKD